MLIRAAMLALCCCPAATRHLDGSAMRDWKIVYEPSDGASSSSSPDDGGGGAYYVALRSNASRAFRAPDAANRGVHGIPHPPFVTQPNWERLAHTPQLVRAAPRRARLATSSVPRDSYRLLFACVLSRRARDGFRWLL